MQNLWKHGIFLATLLGCLVIPTRGSAIEEVVAKIGPVPITRGEMDRERQRLLPRQVSMHGEMSEEKQKALEEKVFNNLVERAYLNLYALQEKLQPDKKVVNETFDKVQKSFKSKKEFRQALGKETPDEFRASLARETLARQVTEKIKDTARLPEAELKLFYDRNQRMFARPKRFRASLIQIKVDADADAAKKEELKKKAESVAAKAKAGEDFYNLAYYNSNDRTSWVGGDIGSLHEGQLVKALEEPLLKLKVGEIAGPIRTDFGYNIIKLTEFEDARQLSFAEAKDSIRRQLEKDRQEALYKEWIGTLKEKYPLQRL